MKIGSHGLEVVTGADEGKRGRPILSGSTGESGANRHPLQRHKCRLIPADLYSLFVLCSEGFQLVDIRLHPQADRRLMPPQPRDDPSGAARADSSDCSPLAAAAAVTKADQVAEGGNLLLPKMTGHHRPEPHPHAVTCCGARQWRAVLPVQPSSVRPP